MYDNINQMEELKDNVVEINEELDVFTFSNLEIQYKLQEIQEILDGKLSIPRINLEEEE